MRTIREITADDVKGRASEDEAAWLRSGDNTKRWKEELVVILHDLQAQLTDGAARLSAYQQQCFRDGDSGKEAFFAAKADYETKRVAVVRYKQKVEERLAEAKRLSRVDDTRDRDWSRIADALERIADALWEGKNG